VHAGFLLRVLLNRSTSSLSGTGQFAADGKNKGAQSVYTPLYFRPADAKSCPPRKMMSGDIEQGEMHTPERQFGLYRIHVQALRVAGIYRHGESGAS
jgi:hypothetical protein